MTHTTTITTTTTTTLEPVTTSGWYERTDGTVSLYTWRSGRLDCDRTVAGWDDVPTAGDLHDYATGEYLRPATQAERELSDDAQRLDGGCGVITVDGRSCYVAD